MNESNNILNSINIERCQYTNPTLLTKLELKLCINCKEVPLPPFRIITNQKQYICKNCLIMNKVKNDLIIEPTSEEIELLSEIVISCKNQGCDKIFKISELKELKSHE